MKTTSKFKCAVLAFISVLPGFSQHLGNLTGITFNGVTDTADYAPILVNTNGNVVVAGNQLSGNQQYDATLVSQVSAGVLSWQDQIASGNRAFSTASTKDASGNIYVVGGVYTSATNGFDYFLSKYNSAGTQLWIVYYNGTNSGNDVASAVTLDPSGNIYITGGSEGTAGALIDYTTIKYSSSGSQIWTSRYNYSNQNDVPNKIALVTSSRLAISGFSGSTLLTYEYATVEYNPSTGAQIAVNRSGAPASQNMAYSMSTDSNGNVFVTGTTGGLNPNVQTMKLDTALNTIWTRTLDLHGFADAGVGIAVDGSNDVVITGYSGVNAANRELFVAKYTNSGTLLWLKTKRDPMTGSSAEGLRVVTDNGDIFVGGNYTTNNNQDVLILQYNSSGKLVFERRYNGPLNNTDKFMDMTVDGSKILVSAKTYSTLTMDKNVTLEYTIQTFSQTVATTTNNIKYDPTNIIIRFHKKALKMAVINNKEIQFGQLIDFVNDSTCSKITAKLDPSGTHGINAAYFPTRKIFMTMIEADSMAQSRTGGMIKIQPYYCTLLITLPSSANNIVAAQTLQVIKPDIHHTEMDIYLETASPNDPYFGVEQAGLHSVGTYSNASVNADSAWSVKGGGEPFVKIGIIDTGVDFTHPDFNGMSNLGFDYYNQTGQSGDSDDHGTGSAGIIAAVRNNNIGISGIAGRDYIGSSQGVTLYDCKACESSQCPMDKVTAALYGAIVSFQCHVVNMSIHTWVTFYNTYGTAPAFTTAIDLMNDANRMGIALVGAKGNLQSLTPPYSMPNYTFPADYSDETTMSVGSNGRDGHYCIDNINCSNKSTTGGHIDFVAPGTDSLVYVTNNNQGYKQEDGTSFATPHVTGAVALMMSYRNNPLPNWNNMVHEDCEQILQRTAKDLTVAIPYQEAVGYDTTTGYGRIDIMRAIRAVDKDYYRFRHITESVGSTSSTRAVNTISNNVVMMWNGLSSFPTGTALTNVYELTSVLNYSLLPTESIVAAWPLNKESFGSKNESQVFIDRPYYSEIISYSNTQAIMRTYYYQFVGTGVYAPYPAANSHSCAITLYTYDSSGSVDLQERESLTSYNCKIYPNPSSDYFKVQLWSDSNSQFSYQVFNLLGESMLSGIYWAKTGDNRFELDAKRFSQGLYFFTIFKGNKPVYTEKIIKQ